MQQTFKDCHKSITSNFCGVVIHSSGFKATWLVNRGLCV